MALTADELEQSEREVELKRHQFLRERGWTRTCDTPGSYWLWSCVLPDNRVILVNQEMALRFAHILAADHTEPDRSAADSQT
jgi:hypothetical protein